MALVGIDASRAVSPFPTGTETYSRRLIQALLQRDPPYRFRLYFRHRLAESPPDLAAPPFSGAEPRIIPFPRLWTHLRLSWEMVQHPPDLLFVPAHVLPLIHPRLSLVTVHDLGYLHFPQAHPTLQRQYLDLSTRWNARAAAHLLADSEATKRDLVTHYGTAPEKITVAYPGFDEGLAPRAAYWDADPYRELVRGNTVRDFDGKVHTKAIEGDQIAWADVLGDWREEIVAVVEGELRIYSTTIPATDRRECLMQDPIYRLDVAHLAMGYLQAPMTSYCLSACRR